MAENCECPPEGGTTTREPATAGSSLACPACAQSGKTIDTLTLKAMLVHSLTELREVDYRFCRTSECSVVYYSADGEQQFLERDLRETVHNKHPDDDGVFVCYCFRHTPQSIKRELAETGRSTVVASITAGIQAGQCACDIRNPQGDCCLGNVHAVVERAVVVDSASLRSTAS
ncbi:MAG: hypothetical protein J4N95_00250 [Chloroflexi bacterium]|nr:hypothetical protein [Chloroflexota bacterium]MCI0855353.1 hypothetical protein [Chloroflexota bacterium]